MTPITGTADTADFAEAAARIAAATGPQDLFGPYDGTPEACLRAAGRTYRRLARAVHPDTAPDGADAEARKAFTRLGDLWTAYQHEITGITGRRLVITTRRRAYAVGEERARGDIATLFRATYADDDGTETFALLKMPRSPADNDLMEREAAALTRIERHGEKQYRAYVPRLVESFRHREGAKGPERRVNVIERVRGFVSLAEVHEAYPDGVDARDVAWMWRRLLVALGYAHRAGVIHGAVVPDHVLIHPRDHGLVLVDWCYAVVTHDGRPAAEHVPALVERWRAMYPPEVTGKTAPDQATDLHMATHCMTYLLGPDAPRPVQRFARGCTLPAQARRPHDAWRLLGELDDLLGRLYGPRRFRPFTMPGT